MDWFHLAQGEGQWLVFVTMVKILQVPQNAGNILNSRGTVACSKETLLHGVNQLIVTNFNTHNLFPYFLCLSSLD